MPQVYVTVLNPASGGFGEWDWVEGTPAEGCEDFFDYEQMLANMTPTLDFERTDALAGRIHREQGRVYRIDSGEKTPDGEPYVSYEMVWIEDND